MERANFAVYSGRRGTSSRTSSRSRISSFPAVEHKDRGKGVGAVVLTLLVAGVVGWVFWMIYAEDAYFTSTTMTHIFTRDINDAPPALVDAGRIFNQAALDSVRRGHGFKAVFSVTNRGASVFRDSVVLPRWTEFHDNGESPDERAGRFLAAIPRFAEMAKKYSSYFPQTWSEEIYVDITEGMAPEFRRQVLEVYQGLKIQERLARGDGLELTFGIISQTDFLNWKPVSFAQGGNESTAPVGAALAQAGVNWLTETRPPSRESSIATGLFNMLGENSGKPNRHVMVFSDGLENSPLTVSLYNDHSWFNSERWAFLNGKITQFEKFPVLAGATVDWYVPNPAKKANLASLIRAGFKYWEYVLHDKCGADVSERSFHF